MKNDEGMIIEALEEGNKWWKEGKSFQVEGFKPRKVYEGEIKKFLGTKQIIAFVGLRRVGKTTLMLKIVEEQIKKGEYDPKNVLYFSFDGFRGIRVREVMKIYARVMNKDLNKGKYLFLFDEIQKLENWGEQIKRIYDNFMDIKMIISGSESLFLRKKSKESLAGRIFEFRINTLTFEEYLFFRGKKIDNIELYKEDILREFKNFLFCNGFPEIINEQGKEVVRKYIKENVIEKIIYRDMPQVFPVKEPAILEGLLKIILYDPGEILSIDHLSKDLGISRQTTSLYLDYLEKSFLIKKLYNFSRNIRKTERKLKKYYPCIIAPEMAEKAEVSGKIFETAMVLQMGGDFLRRDVYKNEVDVIKLINDNKILPVEIKLSRVKTKALRLFMKKFRVARGIILTYDKKEEIKVNGKEIQVMPFYEYLLR